MRLLRNVASYARFLWMTPSADKQVVFYAEQEGYFPIFEGILDELVRTYSHSVCYVTSDPEDPILVAKRSGVRTFYIDSLLQVFMRFLNSRVVVMTLPDLENLHLKRSINPVHYVYMFHSVLSTHMGYREGAFDHYDSILCTSPHQVAEIRRTEELYHLPAKILVKAGYHRLERIREAFARWSQNAKKNEPPIVLIAPTWSKDNLIERYGTACVQAIRESGYEVVLRFHPEMVKRKPSLIAELDGRFRDDDFVTLEKSVAGDDSLLKADLLVTDWSGVAVEYAFGTERPVLFIDLPRKVNNENYENLGLEPFEVSVREEIGMILPSEQIPQIGAAIERLLGERAAYKDRLRELRAKHVYCSWRSNQIGAEHILRILDGRPSELGDGSQRLRVQSVEPAGDNRTRPLPSGLSGQVNDRDPISRRVAPDTAAGHPPRRDA